MNFLKKHFKCTKYSLLNFSFSYEKFLYTFYLSIFVIINH